MKRREAYTLPPFMREAALPNGSEIPMLLVAGQGNFGCRGWMFTDDEKDLIRGAFRTVTHKGKEKFSASEDKIARILNRLELLCSERKYWFLDRPKRAEVRESRKHTLTDCKAALWHLKSIVACEVDLSRYDNHEYFDSEEDDPVTDFRLQSWQEARAALNALEKFVTTIETYHQAEEKTMGRDRADSDNFIKKLGDIYTEHIGQKPTMTEEGTFFKLVKAIYEILGLKIKDPSKTIRAALKKK